MPGKPLRHKTNHKFDIHLNGTLVDTIAASESAATITGLQPGCFYVVRVSLLNPMDFSSKSAPIRFRTKLARSGDFFLLPAERHDADTDAPHDIVPLVAPYRGLKDIAPPSPDAAPMARENSIGIGPSRSVKGRRVSPAAHDLDKHNPPADESEPPEGTDTITALTARLDAIRRETEEIEKQTREEDEEELRQKEDLVKERDELRAEALEKDKASRNLKKEVNTLERQNTNAQNERTKTERLLQQKKQEREKLKEDMIRWEQESATLKEDLEKIHEEKEEFLVKSESEKAELRTKQAEEATAVRALDDEVREKGSEIKKLERAMKNSSPNGVEPEQNLVQQFQQDAEERRLFEIQYQSLQHQYAMTAQKLEQAKRFCAEQQAYLDSLRVKRRQEEAANYAPPPATQEKPLRRGDSQRSRRAQSGHSSSDSPRPTNFHPITSAPFASGLTGTSSGFAGLPFMNVNNGMTIRGPTGDLSISDEERDRLTGGAPMSPGAGAELLPTDLFSEGENRNKLASGLILPGLGSLPGLPGLPGPSLQPALDPGPASPTSDGSRSPSVFASPRASQQNLVGSPEAAVIDSDRRSIRSTRSNRAQSGAGAGSRFGGMFGIKQRAKTTSADEGPALGKASSMPRQDGGLSGIDSNTRKRNSSISGSGLSGLPLGAESGFDVSAGPSATRRSRFGIFGKSSDGGGWPTFTSLGRRPTSPRPGSTHSNELPRPSMDSSRWGPIDGWGPGDAASGNRSSPLAFGTGWNNPSASQSRIFASRHPSRRPSAQYGVSGPPDDIMEDEDSDALDPVRAASLGPIGSKPPPGSKKADKAAVQDSTAALNPAAKDFQFKSLLSSMKLSSKSKDNSLNAGSATNTTNLAPPEDDDLSPPNSRKSRDTRDTRSINTAESSLAESGRNSTDLARTASYTNSDVAPSPLLGSGGSSVGRESFMQKLTRKSSSSKFGMPGFTRRTSKLDTSIQTPTSVPPNEEDEEAGSLSASISSVGRESKENNRGSGRNWSNVLKLGSKKDKKGNETPSVSGLSITTSGTEDDDDGGYEER